MRNGCLTGRIAAIFLFVALPPFLSGQEKLAQSGFEFLSIGTVGRASGMGEAFTTVSGTSTALLYNPAGLARMERKADLSASWNRWIADITQYSFTVAFAPAGEKYGAFGISALWVDYGEFQGTLVWNNKQGFVDTEKFTPRALAVGIGYAKTLTDKFTVGGQIKLAAQSAGRNVVPSSMTDTGLDAVHSALSTWAFDFGTLYRTGFKSLVFGMSVRNFSKEVKFVQEGFQLPVTFRIGIGMNLFDFFPALSEAHAFNLAADLVHPRSHGEYVCAGCEYRFIRVLSLRAGWISGQDENSLTYGFGLEKSGMALDYAYTPFGVFDNVQRVTLRLSL
ncbi:PorV/PorQ family protein [bacterium]|nr:PorV/PorQ family protein [bacterium]